MVGVQLAATLVAPRALRDVPHRFKIGAQLASIYLYLGSLHWETRLVAQFGEEYREYQQRVHRIIPSKSEYY